MTEFQANWKPIQTVESVTNAPAPAYLSAPVNNRVLYLYFDESGNFDFRPSGTPYFLMTCAATFRPFNVGGVLTNLRYDLIEHGKCLEEFHACEDKNDVREYVYDVLSIEPQSFRVYSAIVHKAAVPEQFRTAKDIYSKVFAVLMDEVYKRECNGNVEKVIAITDNLPKDAKRSQVTRPLKRYMKQLFQDSNIPYQLLHHKSCSDPNLQAVDYFYWAAHRDLTQNKTWPLSKCVNSFREVGEIVFPD